MSSLSRNNHTVPRFYLRRFAHDSKVGAVLLPGEDRYLQSTKSATVVRDFYILTDESGEETDVFEKALGDVENAAAIVIRKVVEDNTWPLSRDDRMGLGEFIAVQHLRGPDSRRAQQQLAALIATLIPTEGGDQGSQTSALFGGQIDPEALGKIWDGSGADANPLNSAVHIQNTMSALPEVFKYFVGRPWFLFRFSTDHLLTSDTPVCLVAHPDIDADAGLGLANSIGILFPLSRDVGLLMGDPTLVSRKLNARDVLDGAFDAELGPDPSTARLFNSHAILNARSYIFHHPDDGDLVPDSLPDERTVEVMTDDSVLAKLWNSTDVPDV